MIPTSTPTSLGGAALALLLALGGSVSQAQELDSPKAVVRKTTDDVIAVLRNEELSTDEKIAAVEEVVDQHLDFQTLARLVLARHWRQISEDQQAAFVHEFKKNLSVTYGNNVESYENEIVEIVGERDEARGDKTVLTKIRRSAGKPFLVDYRLRNREGRWRIIDVVVEGVSLVSNYRSQFGELIGNGGIDRLLEVLRKKNAEGETLES